MGSSMSAAEEKEGPSNFKRYEPFFQHVVGGNWQKAMEFLELEGLDIYEAVRVKDPRDQHTALNLAAKEGKADIVKKLLEFMRKEDIEAKNALGYTPLGSVARKGYGGAENYLKASRYLVENNKDLLTIDINDPPHNWFPVVEACSWNRWDLARYLYSVTPREALLTETRRDGPQILTYCFKHAKGFDIARDILRCNPILALTKNHDEEFPILVLARMHSASSGKQLKHWQKWIYNSILIKLVDPVPEISIDVPKQEDDQGCKLSSDGVPTQALEEEVCTNNHHGARWTTSCLGIKSIYEQKLIHTHNLEFIHCISEGLKEKNLTEQQLELVKSSVYRAVEQGNIEFVKEMFNATRKKLGRTMRDEMGRTIFHVAIAFRQEHIYNLIYGLRKEKKRNLGCSVTVCRESMLHMTGNLSPLSKFNHIKGEYLQMQRELQWFQEVKSIVPVEMHDSLNTSNETAHELFTKNHAKLMEDAEKSIKETATSCTVVGALIVTIMFAVTFTVPGGNDNNTGLPFFMDRKLFKIFIFSDVISLVSSTTSVIICLGILTSRFAEDDFLTSLPTKMMIGLSTLLLSISTMMIAFSCTLTIMMGDHGTLKTFIRNLLFVSVPPITSFIWMQFPLLIDIFISTYGPGIFNKNAPRMMEFCYKMI